MTHDDACKCTACLPQCLWCGHHGLYGSALRERPRHPKAPVKHECVDAEQCAARIKRRQLLGP